MRELFQNVLTASFHGSIVILVVMLLRLVLKRTPKKFFCMLWLLAGVRLLMPFEIQSSMSLQPNTAAVVEERWQAGGEVLSDLEPDFLMGGVVEPEGQTVDAPVFGNDTVTLVSSAPAASAPAENPDPDASASPIKTADKPAVDWVALVPYFWIAVMGCFALSCIYSYLRLRYQVREAVKIPGGWECDRIETAFILGFIKPQIYIPMGMSASNRKYILAHERTHLEKGDHWFKMIGYLALAVHWFNPLVWAAYILLCKDIEMACDERVVQFMNLEERKHYSAALLNCSTNRAHFAACPVAFGEVSVKSRIKSVLNYRKPSFWISLLGVIAIIFVAVCLVTSPAKETDEPAAGDTEPTSNINTVTVQNVNELLAAIAPDTEIRMEAGTYNLSKASNYGDNSGSEYYAWSPCADGYQLDLTGVENLTIRGSGKLVTILETEPRYANVIALQNCSNVILEDFTAGHTREQGECSGGVLYLQECAGVDMNRLGLYGCGTVGLRTQKSSNVALTDGDVYDCSSSAAVVENSENVTISGSRIYNIGSESYGAYVYFDVTSSQNVTVENCEISGSTVMSLTSIGASAVRLTNNLFTGNRIQQAAFNIQHILLASTGQELSSELVLDGNKFEGNSIRHWFSGDTALDKDGNTITEEQMNSLYSEEPEETRQTQLEIHVSTVDELIAAIGPDTEIVLDAELYDFSTATGYGTSQGDYYYWEDIFDGPGLIINAVDNLTIRSNDGNVTGHTIAAVPRYADVLTFKGCSNITLSGFTAGHTREPGSCTGGVLEFRDSDQITVDNCGLYGCGILGVYAEYSSNILVANCDIYECSQGGVQFRDSQGIVLKNNTFRDLGGINMDFISCADVTVDGEVLIAENNVGSAEIQSPEQADMLQLDNLLKEFAHAYFDGDTQTLSADISSSYAGEVETYSGEKNKAIVCWYEVSVDMWKEAKSAGHYKFSYPYRKDADSEIDYLSIEVVRENDAWKVSAYALEE